MNITTKNKKNAIAIHRIYLTITDLYDSTNYRNLFDEIIIEGKTISENTINQKYYLTNSSRWIRKTLETIERSEGFVDKLITEIILILKSEVLHPFPQNGYKILANSPNVIMPNVTNLRN